MRILITGGAGFLGSELVAELAKSRANELFIFDSYVHGYPTKLLKKKNIKEYIVGNIRDYSTVARVVEKSSPDVVIHLAAQITRPEAVGEFRTCCAVNYTGTANLLDACLRERYKPKKIIFASTSAVSHPTSHYGISKLAAESLLESICPLAGIELGILRFSEIYGISRSQTSKALVHFLIDNMLADQLIAVFDVNKQQDCIHISDAVNACLLAIKSKEPLFSVDIGTGAGITTKKLIEKLKTLIKFKGKFEYLSDVPGIRVCDIVTNPIPAKQLLSFECTADFDTELRALVAGRKKDLK